ncbi:TonB-dependent receptor [Arundinibacter roseus]|uniref:TonB-dependent receptor n=1 Tax=Arundinibacter roseus TaxID=2070510 RepID=A0A4R4KH90_9BACT|nr:TonB-dependent receptor [Arundinibacter roseus]TDB67450.1 TonB-dependent receptor [Arundinibacter roseus]
MYAKILSALFFILTITPPLLAQKTLTGLVTDLENRPIEGANILLSIPGENKTAVSDKDGYFEIRNLTQSSYTLLVSIIGFETRRQLVEIDGSMVRQIIQLAPSETTLQQVEIIGRANRAYTSEYSFSATKIAIKNKDLPQGISTVTKELIADRQAFHLADAVKIASGVIPSSFYNQYAIRGISQNEEGQIINGMRTRQYYFLQPLTTNIERVEVLKGPASVSFSSVDPGGSINMVTKKPLSEKHREVSLSAGSFSTMRATLDFTGPLNESKTLLYRLNGAYQEARSFRDLVSNKSVLVSPSISYIPNDKTAINTELIFSNLQGNLDRGQPIFGAIAGQTDLNSTPISLNLGAANDFFKSKELILMANLSHKFTQNFSFIASYMKQTWTEDLQEHRTTNAFAVDITGVPVTSLVGMQMVQRRQFWNTDNLNAYFTLNFGTGKISHKLVAGYDLQSWHKLKGGGQNAARGFLLSDGSATNTFNVANAANYQTIRIGDRSLPRPNANYFDLNNPTYTIRNVSDYVLNSRVAVPSALTTTHAVYVQQQMSIGKLALLLSLRQEWFEDITNYNAPSETAFTNSALLPRIGLTYTLNAKINVYGTYLEGYQPQSNTVTLMPSTGNFFWATQSAAQFLPLESDLKELGIKAEFFDNRLTWNAAVYEINQKNILMNANDPANPDLLVQRGADRSRGFETDLAGYIFPNWQINASYSYIDAKIIQDATESLIDQRKENVPKHSGNVWTRYNFATGSAVEDLGIGAGIHAQGSRIPWFTRAFEVPGFATIDAAIYYNPTKSKVQVALNMNNILNSTYWVGAQNYTRLFPGTPRNFMLTVTYKF